MRFLKSVQLIKKLNNTELGKSGTHDTYILVPKTLDVTDIFPEVNTFYQFIDKEDGDVISIRRTEGRETRIVGLGQYYTKRDLCAGDEIYLEKRLINGENAWFIDCNKKTNRVMLQKSSYGFEVLTPERIELFNDKLSMNGKKLALNFLEAKKKRQDSPDTTDFYELLLDGEEAANGYSSKEIIEIEIVDNEARINRFVTWKKSIVETGDEC